MAYVKIIKTLRNFIIYPAIVFVVLGISLYVAPQTVAAISPPPPPEPEIYIEASLDENFFTQETQERVCLDQGCTFVLEPEQDSDAYYLKKAHEQGQKEELSLLGIVSLEEGSVLITPSSSQEEISLDEKALVEALDMLIENDISPIESDLLQTLERWADWQWQMVVIHCCPHTNNKGQENSKSKE
ncbi:MAG: hypothetical protein U5L75_01870 [Candidatus Campbellbacteria bacterium]|nr:hypothetical protein [Candidatus Campbellbacteria bacterium]